MPVRVEEPPRHEPPPIATLRPVDAHSFRTSAIRNSPYEDDEDEDEDMGWGEGGPIVMTDDDYDSEEPPHAYKYQPAINSSTNSSTANNYTGSNHPHPPPIQHNHIPPRHASGTGLHGVFSSPYHPPPPQTQDNSIIDRLRQEVEALKRQSADQEHLTLRLSNQLTRAETEAARAKQALKMAESRLEDEARRRIEAERAADEEARMRRQAEDGLRVLQMRTGISSPR